MNIKIDQNKKTVGFIRYSPLHEKEFIRMQRYLRKNTNSLVITHLKKFNVNEFLNQVYQFEKEKEYQYKTKLRKSIYAVELEILLPQYMDTLSKKRKLIRWYIRYLLADLKVSLNYFAYEIMRGKGTYLKLIIFEREWINKEIYDYYTRNHYSYYTDEEGMRRRKISIEKGTIKQDEFGNKKKKFLLFGNKLRLFNESSFERLIQRCFQILADAYQRITQQKIEHALRFKRVYAKASMHKYQRKVIQMINGAKTSLEIRLNAIYTPAYHYVYEVDEGNQRYLPEEVRLRQITRLFQVMSNIFKQNEFTYEEERYRINYRFVNVEELRQSIEKLFAFFDKKMQKII